MSIGTPYKRFAFSGDYDTLVIGSGIGGLASAALLAKHAGERVLVLERHYTAGGFTHAFERPGYDWDVGVHYIGDVDEPGMATRRMFDYVTDGRLSWADMGEVYDVIEIGDRRYELVKGKRAFVAKLKSYFPGEERAIDRYMANVAATVKWSSLFFAEKALPKPLSLLFGTAMRYPALRYARRTTADVLDSLTDNVELKAVLSGQWGDYGLPPKEGSFLIHALVAHHYFEGAAYPVGGATRIAETILPVIEAAGGAVLVRAEVTEILVEHGRATGVRMADGRVLRARRVISAAGVAVTYGKLLPESVRTQVGLSSSRPSVPPSTAHLSLYLGLDRSAAELGLRKPNRWLYPSPDHDENVAAFLADPDAPFPVVYLSFPAAKDPDFERRHPGHATLEAITIAPYAWFARWEDTPWGKRGEDYEAFKQRLTQRLLQAVERAEPSIAGHVAHAELSTPLSTRHFAGHPHGEIYGLGHQPRRFEDRSLRPQSPIPGLLLTGADVCSTGVAGALSGAVLTTSVALRCNMMSVVLRRQGVAQTEPVGVAAS
jgi:all-trans-retinol 13,14-reductase